MKRGKLKLLGFNNLTKTLSFNMYDICYASTETERKKYIAYIDEVYSAERLTQILVKVAEMIGAHVLNIASQDYDPQGASVTMLIAEEEVEKQDVVCHLDKSHITVHTYPEMHPQDGICTFRADIDVSTCGKISPLNALNFLLQSFDADIVITDYRVRGFTRDVQGKKIFIDHRINSIQNYMAPKLRYKYDMVDVNVYQENIFHTKMLIHDFNLDNYLFDMKEAELDRKEGKRIRRLLKQEMYEYREMIFSLVKKDLRGRYKGSMLGFMWTFINPLLQLLVFTLVFSIIMRANYEQYYLFLFVALVPWMFFGSSVQDGSTCIMRESNMVKKIYFPREVIPISTVTSAFINMILTFVVVFIVLIFSGRGINPVALLYLPVVMIVEYILCLGIGLIVSALTVYLRDLQYILGIVVMALQYMTPVMYGVDMVENANVPQILKTIFNLNPMTPIINIYRQILYYKQIPDLSTLLVAIITGVVFVILGAIIFRRLQRGFAEEF